MRRGRLPRTATSSAAPQAAFVDATVNRADAAVAAGDLDAAVEVLARDLRDCPAATANNAASVVWSQRVFVLV